MRGNANHIPLVQSRCLCLVRRRLRQILIGVMLAGFAVPLLLPSTDRATAQTADDLVAEGRRLAEQKACAACHSIDGARGVGPTWKDLAGSPVKLADGQTVTADDAYLTQSILDPDAQIVDGFPQGVMAANVPPGSVSEREAEAIVAYIKSLGPGGAGAATTTTGAQATTTAAGQGGTAAPAVSAPPTASPSVPRQPAVYHAGWALLGAGVLLAVIAIVGYVRYLPRWRERR